MYHIKLTARISSLKDVSESETQKTIYPIEAPLNNYFSTIFHRYKTLLKNVKSFVFRVKIP